MFILGKSCLRNFQIQVNFDNFRLDIAKAKRLFYMKMYNMNKCRVKFFYLKTSFPEISSMIYTIYVYYIQLSLRCIFSIFSKIRTQRTILFSQIFFTYFHVEEE